MAAAAGRSGRFSITILINPRTIKAPITKARESIKQAKVVAIMRPSEAAEVAVMETEVAVVLQA